MLPKVGDPVGQTPLSEHLGRDLDPLVGLGRVWMGLRRSVRQASMTNLEFNCVLRKAVSLLRSLIVY